MKSSKKFNLSLVNALLVTFLSACANQPDNRFRTEESYLLTEKQGQNPSSGVVQAGATETIAQSNALKIINAKPNRTNSTQNTEAYEKLFSENELVEVVIDNLRIEDYLHYVLGETLGVSYIVGDRVSNDSSSITLNFQKPISKRRLFQVSRETLEERGFSINYDNDLFYVHKEEDTGRGSIVFGYGKQVNDIPNTSSDIVQIVPFEFGVQSQLSLVIQSLAQVKVTPALSRNAFILRGKQKEIRKALEFINLMDQPAYKNRRVGLFQATYVSTDELKGKLTELLSNEGIDVASPTKPNGAVSIVTLERIGTTVFFAPNEEVLGRINFWVQQIDQPPNGDEPQYFMYHPKFSRASDLGESLQILISGGPAQDTLSGSTSAQQQNSNSSSGRGSQQGQATAAKGDGISMVVDERANALIFYAAGDRYKSLLPMIKRLDVMPKQVILEIMIAEVTLTDTFRQGFDFELTNRGDADVIGGFNLESGSEGLSYVLSSVDGSLTVNLLETNSNVNVLSRPSLLVRDGVTANINVGNDIPTVGEINTDPVNGTQTSVVYRSTGVELSVKPTINAQGVIIMEIDQMISNQAEADDSVAGSPIIFERTIKTEVIAESGQTIVLGGLISENNSRNDRRVPFFSDIPLLGKLFDGKNDTIEKTELVVLVTPKVIESTNEWTEIKHKFSSKLKNIDFNQ